MDTQHWLPERVQELWLHLRASELSPSGPSWLLTWGISFAIFILTYWVLGLALLPLNFLPDGTEGFAGRKCQKGKRMSWADIRKILRCVTWQQCLVYPAALYILSPIVARRCAFGPELPGLWEVAQSAAFFAICSEVWFFHAHWALHHPRIYPRVHKVHHEFTHPIALECIYFHPVESVIQLGVVASGPLLLGSHITLMWLWTFVSLVNVLVHHCGYEVPFDDAPVFGRCATAPSAPRRATGARHTDHHPSSDVPQAARCAPVLTELPSPRGPVLRPRSHRPAANRP